MTRVGRIGVLAVALLGAFVFLLLTVGSLGEPNPDVSRLTVSEVLSTGSPADAFGDEQLHVSGWYAELDADCREDAPAGLAVPWLERTCPLRVLLAEQPAEDVTQAELATRGLRLAAPTGQPFPSRARPGGPNLRLQQLVFAGHFDDPAASDCATDLVARCRNTFVVMDYDGLLR